MKLHIENLGPIKKGTIDLNKRVYLFVGYNNSGKTYVAQLLWQLFKLASIRDYSNFSIKEIDELDLNTQSELQIELTEKFIENILNQLLTNLRLNHLFGIEEFHHILKNVHLEFDYNLEDIYSKKICKNYSFLEILKDSNSTILNLLSKISSTNKDIKNSSKDNIAPFLSLATKDAIKTAIGSLFLERRTWPFFLPASRSFYLANYKYIINAEREENRLLRERGSDLNLEELRKLIPKANYTKAAEQLINRIHNLKDKPIKNYQKFVKALESILGGKFKAENIVEGISPKKFSFLLKNEKELPLHLASSSVNQLLSLYLYFKYWAVPKNGFLMIDEPEENLHPKNQSKLTELLLDYAGINSNRLLINTHSSLITEVINNYILLSKLKHEAGVKEHEDYGKYENILKPEDIGIYFFNGTEIREYTIGEYGTIFKDFDREIYKVKNKSEELSKLIFENLQNANQ